MPGTLLVLQGGMQMKKEQCKEGGFMRIKNAKQILSKTDKKEGEMRSSTRKVIALLGGLVLLLGLMLSGNAGAQSVPGYTVMTFASGLPGVRGVSIDPAGNVYTMGRDTGIVYKISPAGVVNVFANLGAAYYVGPYFDTVSGDVFVAQHWEGGSILRIDSLGNVSTFVTGINYGSGFETDKEGNLYVPQFLAGDLLKITPEGNISTYATGLNLPDDVAFGQGGELYVDNRGTNQVMMVAPGGGVAGVFASGFNGPLGIVSDSIGNLYVASFFDGTLQKVSPEGNVSLFGYEFGKPLGLAFDPGGNLFIADFGNNAIYKIFNVDDITMSVSIDVEPGMFPNTIYPLTNELIPVAILTTDTFDATAVDPTTVLFGATGTEAAPVSYTLQDVNGDGKLDMVLYFNTQETGLECGDTSAVLTGANVYGWKFQGSDSISTICNYTVTPSAGTNGSIGPSTPQSVAYNTTTSFVVTPDHGYHIASISGCGGTSVGTQPNDTSYVYTTGQITADCTVTATFAPNQHTLTVNTTGNGSGSVGGGGTYDYGANISVTATASTGSTFSGWSGDCSGTTSPYSVTMLDRDMTCTATFTKETSSFPPFESFVIGDQNAVVGNTVTFWGSQWEKKNSLSGGSVNASFKGFANGITSPSCGGTWTAAPGNSSKPPVSLPAYIAVIVSSHITKSGNTISGDIKEIVIVKTNAGYAPDPGHAGTGTVVGVICQQ